MADWSPPDDRTADDHVVAVLERTLATYAGQAPPAVGLPDRVHRTRRRRTLVQTAVGTSAAIAVAAAIVVPMSLGDETESVGPAVDAPDPGWRWESYAGVELQVPDSWGTGTTWYPWCGGQVAKPYVGRPIGVIPLVACSEATLSEAGDRFVWFGGSDAVGTTTDAEGWVRETRRLGELTVTVQLDDPALAERILDSARVYDAADWAGCAADHPLAATSDDLRPEVPWDVAAGDVVLGGTVCRYALPEVSPPSDGMDRPPSHIASRSLTAEEATAVRNAVAAAPTGTGPNDPARCSADRARGDEAIVVTLSTESGSRELFVRYSGCDHHGVDDATTVRKLTPETASTVFDAALLPPFWSAVLDDVFAPIVGGAEAVTVPRGAPRPTPGGPI